ncbi:hypothetical protein ACFL6S_08415 [Candidatus Poribacteria bacterium]
MTLCIAWIRKVDESEELVFATDSYLTGGERWKSIKLFELPRKDCLICFAGSTSRAYPLILNLISSINSNDRLSDQRTDIYDVLAHLTELFSDLIKDIVIEVKGQDIDKLKGEAEFIFGGWSWQKQQFCIWHLYYSKDAKGFIFADRLTGSVRPHAIIGTKESLADAKALLKKELDEDDEDDRLLGGPFDMEPLKVLARMARETKYGTIGGAPQIAKVYKSGISEFFGIKRHEQYTLLGRKQNRFSKPSVRYIDLDTSGIIEDQLPSHLTQVDNTLFGDELDFIQECYPEGKLKDQLSDQEKEKLHIILSDVAYRSFVDLNESQAELSEEVADKNE